MCACVCAYWWWGHTLLLLAAAHTTRVAVRCVRVSCSASAHVCEMVGGGVPYWRLGLDIHRKGSVYYMWAASPYPLVRCWLLVQQFGSVRSYCYRTAHGLVVWPNRLVVGYSVVLYLNAHFKLSLCSHLLLLLLMQKPAGGRIGDANVAVCVPIIGCCCCRAQA